MSRGEFLEWAQFYKLFPFDDLHRFHRPAAMIASAMGGAGVSERLDWLQPPSHEYSDADMNTLRAFGIKG
jgi:hypothetical protein